MNNSDSRSRPPAAPENPPGAAFHRSSAVARMLRMPVATLRVWERRYGLTQPALSPGGQRLYSADDVRRLTLIKRLSDLGHAIGHLAPLEMPQLRVVAATHAQALAAAQAGEPADTAHHPPDRAWRLVVIGGGLGVRLARPALLRRLGRPVQLLGPFEDAAQAAAALRGSDIDAVLFHAPQLQDGWLEAIEVAAPAWARVPKAVLYGFAAEPVCEALASAGTALLREPQPDVVLAQWLHSLSAATLGTPRPSARNAVPSPVTVPMPVPPRRWDEAALAEFAGRSSTMACECPRHVAELLVQLSHFEAYSAQCASRGPADAELHAHLGQVAAASRARFEHALERVALHEGLLLPSNRPTSHG